VQSVTVRDRIPKAVKLDEIGKIERGRAPACGAEDFLAESPGSFRSEERGVVRYEQRLSEE
jgi:hypothetical protein